MLKKRIGYMQGRLSPMVNGKIQAFPWHHWQQEFPLANKLGILKMEWTLDQEDLYKNPLMTKEGQLEISSLLKEYHMTIPSLTGDCFMQAPFFKDEATKNDRLNDFEKIVSACGVLGIRYVVFPLVDNSSITNELEEKILIEELVGRTELYKKNNIQIVFESDFPSSKLENFIQKFPKESFGINYDIGNSASLGFDPSIEIPTYGDRIYNVHVKDRLLGGTTVPLGLGNANFDVVFEKLLEKNYSGNFILQTARAQNNEHEEFLTTFTEFVLEKTKKWI